MTEAVIETNKVFEFLMDSTARVTSLRGGTRSGKTTNTLIYWVIRLLQETGKVLTVGRQTMPALRASAMRDFFEILHQLGLYEPTAHNKTSNEYTLHGNLVEFVGLQEDRRVRGRKRNYLFLNEANECDLEAFRQLAFRTTEKIVLDYNPSEPFSWVYDDVETREDCDLLVTTYLDNPFLEDSIRAEIERLKDADADYWKIYGLGERASGTALVFNHWKLVTAIPAGERKYGLDFGYNNPTALVEVTMWDNELFWREILYETKLTTADLIERLKMFPELVRGEIIADSEAPEKIEEISRAGFNVKPARKGQGSVKASIDFVKSKPLRIHSDSSNLLREIKRYSWKTDRDGKLTDEVIKFDDHLVDGGRYASLAFNEPPFEVTDEERRLMGAYGGRRGI